MLHRVGFLLLGLTAGLLCGCYERVAHGNQAIYRFAWWIGPLVIVGGLLGIPVGWVLRRWSRKYGFVLMALGPVLLIIVAPAMYSDRVIIDDDHFEARYGLWFSPAEHNIRFQDLREIQYVGVAGNRGRTNYELRCVGKNGQVSVVAAGDLLKNTVPEILEKAKARGVVVVDQTAASGL